MINIEITDKIDENKWNSLVRSVTEGNIFQTTYWADYLARNDNFRPVFFIANEDGVCKGILLFWIEILTSRTRPYNKLLRILEYCSVKANLAYGYWSYGPLIFDKANQEKIAESFISKIDEFAKQEKLVAIRNLIPPISYPGLSLNKNVETIYFLHKFNPIVKATLFLDLSKDPDVLWKELKNGTKKDVTKCLKNNIKVQFIEKNELKVYNRLIIENMRRAGLELPPFYPDENMWEALRNKETCVEVISIKKNSEMLGAMGLLEFNGIIFRIAPCQSNFSFHHKMNVIDLITWESIKWGVNNKKRIYELTGIPFQPKSKKDEGIRRFKLKWSNNLIVFNGYEKIYRANVRKAIDFIKGLV